MLVYLEGSQTKILDKFCLGFALRLSFNIKPIFSSGKRLMLIGCFISSKMKFVK